MTSTSDPAMQLGPLSAPADIRQAILDRATEEGFEQMGFMSPTDMPDLTAQYDQVIAQGWHGDMDWLAQNLDRRLSPTTLWEEARSVFVVGMNYGPEGDPLANLPHPDRATISCYAQHRDYHDVIKKKLRRLARWIAETMDTDVKIFVDTAPVAEKPLAQLAGIGWQGKHTNLVSRHYGSWLFIGSIFIALDLPKEAPHADRCGGCHACLDGCPTDAFPQPYVLEPRRCISYLTIEHKGPIPHEFREAMGNRIYGCDDCLAVCPWNKFAQRSAEAKFHARDDLSSASLLDLVQLDDPSFRQLFSGSPIKRIKRGRFIRNVLVALGNSGDKQAIGVVKPLLADPSPLVRGAAIWALSRLMVQEDFKALRAQHLPQEPDSEVQQEWQHQD